MFYEAAMQPAEVFVWPSRVDFQPENRKWQGIASLERTKGGRLFSIFYSGQETEQNGNFVCVVVSDDNGKTWVDPFVTIQHPDIAGMRVFDPNVWLDPLGRLWITWAQSHDYFDGRDGVWAVRWDSPDEPLEKLVLTQPRRIANGIMMCKPIVRSNGEWLFPCAVWGCIPPAEEHPELAQEIGANVYVSTDNGETFTFRGGAHMPNRHFDEHMVVERRDGSLWMLVRRYDGVGEAFSYDGGCTWWQEHHAGITGPSSRFFIRRLKSGNLLLVNHVDWHGRNNLMAKLSFDDGKTWVGGLMLDERNDVSYPDGTQDDDGLIYIAHDRERYNAREVLMSVFTEQDVLAGRLTDARSRLKVPVSKATGER